MQTHTITLALCYSRHTYMHIYTHTCNVKWMQVAISFCLCHTKCANICQLFIFAIYCKVFDIVLYASVLYFIIILSSWLKRYSILQNVSLFCFCSSLIRLHKESRWVAGYVHTQHLNRYPNVLNLNRDGSHGPQMETIYIIMCNSNNEWGSVVRRNQANSHSQCSERKTWLFLLHVRAGVERVLFIWNITCLYSDWISRFNSMLVHDCPAAGWEQGFELWLFQKGWGLEQLVSQHDGLKPDLRGPIMAGRGV